MSDPVLAITHALTEAMSEQPKPSEPEERTTDSVLKSMLTENTGRHMLDSGGAYGRNWERNQKVDFEAQPHVEVDWRWDYIDVTANLFPCLREVLEYREEADRFFEAWATTGERAREPWLPLMEEFVETFAPLARGMWGDGRPTTINTYNGESWLSQVLQYTIFEIEEDTYIDDPEASVYVAKIAAGYGEVDTPSTPRRSAYTSDEAGDAAYDLALEKWNRYTGALADPQGVVLAPGTYILLQIHGGCDVRGGYTQPRLFEVDPEELLFVGEQVFIGCSECEARWFGRCGDAFEPEDADEDLHDYDTLDISKPENFAAWTARNIVRDALDNTGDDDFQALMEENFPVLGRAYYGYPTNHNVSYCPECGTGELQADGGIF